MKNPEILKFDNVGKNYINSAFLALSEINFTIYEGEFITILGSSGSGKTTILKLIMRLIEPSDGHIKIFGEEIERVNKISLRRRLGYVIQQIGLFPHMTIYNNIAIMPKLLKWDKETIKSTVVNLMNMIGLDSHHYADRYPAELSGGQQQRVGLARALVLNPKIILADEPFGALDAITRETLQNELIRLQAEFKSTVLFVTHDINEAFKLGHRVMIMHEGRISQFDTPQNIIKNPKDEFVKTLIEAAVHNYRLWSDFHD